MEETVDMRSNTTLLYDQSNHISAQSQLGQEVEPVRLITLDSKSQMWKLTPQMQEYVHRTGLHHLADLHKVKINDTLINALIKRWRPETNTFHFVCGEVTITVEDMSFLYGLPIDGRALTGPVWSTRARLEETVLKQLGVDTGAYLRGGQLSLSWIQKKFSHLPDIPSAVDEIRGARAYLFCLVSSQLLTNNAGARGHAYLLEVFENFERYGWGPACLECIYHSMTQATLIKDRLGTITGPLQLIQIWAYSRTAVGRPLRRGLDALLVEFPLYKMWRTVLSIQSCSTPIQEVRRLLDTMEGQQECQPYRHLIVQLEQFVEPQDRKLFCSLTPLIYYWIIERHNVDRVYKQFSLRQPVPPPSNRWKRLNEKASTEIVDYADRLKEYVDAWEHRDTIVLIGGANEQLTRHSDDYLSWYRQAWLKSAASSESASRARIENALIKVDLFLQFGAGSITLMDQGQGADSLYEQAMRIGRKMQEFRESIKSLAHLEELNLEGFINEGFSDIHDVSVMNSGYIQE